MTSSLQVKFILEAVNLFLYRTAQTTTVMCKSALSSPMDWILRYIKTDIYFFFYSVFTTLAQIHGILWKQFHGNE